MSVTLSQARHAVWPKILQVLAAHAPGSVGRKARVILRWRTYCGRCAYVARSQHRPVRIEMLRQHRSVGCWETVADRTPIGDGW